jgi:hypothetical protein
LPSSALMCATPSKRRPSAPVTTNTEPSSPGNQHARCSRWAGLAWTLHTAGTAAPRWRHACRWPADPAFHSARARRHVRQSAAVSIGHAAPPNSADGSPRTCGEQQVPAPAHDAWWTVWAGPHLCRCTRLHYPAAALRKAAAAGLPQPTAHVAYPSPKAPGCWTASRKGLSMREGHALGACICCTGRVAVIHFTRRSHRLGEGLCRAGSRSAGGGGA